MPEEEVKLYLEVDHKKITLVHAKKFVDSNWKDYSAEEIKNADKKYNSTTQMFANRWKRKNTTKRNVVMHLKVNADANDKTKLIDLQNKNHQVILREAMIKENIKENKWKKYNQDAISVATESYNQRYKKALRTLKKYIR